MIPRQIMVMALAAGLAIAPTRLAAQEASQVADVAKPDMNETAGAAQDASTPVVWVAGAAGGLLDRDGGSQSPYGTASITAYRGKAYARGAFTAYRSTLEQPDAALPSTYYLGSFGTGGNFNNWLIDAYVSVGRQEYGLVETSVGKRRPLGSKGSDYFAAGVRAGRLLHPAERLYVTPSIEFQFVDTKSLHHRIAMGEPVDYEVPERALTGNIALRVDQAVGREGQHFVGLSLSHFESDNGLTVLTLDQTNPDLVVGRKTPDSWQQAGANATLRLSSKLWLDLSAARTFGAVSGDSTTLSAGLRLRL